MVAVPQRTPPVEVRSARGTTGRVLPPELPTVQQNPSSTTLDEDVVVRQTIARFADTYRSRFGRLAFVHCDIGRDGNEAKANCVPRGATDTSGVESNRVWKFALRKTDGAWKIVSMQPPPDAAQ
jgi:hypothetical protein